MNARTARAEKCRQALKRRSNIACALWNGTARNGAYLIEKNRH